jgi:hypothetical protein
MIYQAATLERSNQSPVYFEQELTSSVKKAWEDIHVTVSEKMIDPNTNIARQMLKQQEATVKKIWDTPENDQWDEL